MADSTTPRRPRFPLKLAEAQPRTRRLVGAIVDAPMSAGGPVATVRRKPPPLNLEAPSQALASVQASARSQAPSVLAQSPADVRAAEAPARLSAGAHALPGPRLQMVERLRLDGSCLDVRVLQAMAAVPRHCFLDDGLQSQAYEDTSLPIGLGQTISKPSVVARMLALALQRLGQTPVMRALEIGTGCGYQAAVMSLLARQVYSVERLQGLYDRARANLAPLRSDNLRLILGDGHHGHPPNAPYDVIIAAAGGQSVPERWLEQLAPGGRLVAPSVVTVGGPQVLVVVDRLPDGRLQRSHHETVRFVPLESGVCKGQIR